MTLSSGRSSPHGPQLCNSDGDEIAFTAVRYPLKETCDRKALKAALTAMPGPATHGRQPLELDAPAPRRRPGRRPGRRSSYHVDPQRRFCHRWVTSSWRRKRSSWRRIRHSAPKEGGSLLEPVIGPYVGEPVVEQQTAGGDVRCRRRRPKAGSRHRVSRRRKNARSSRKRSSDITTGFSTSLCRCWANVSPRKAAKTKKGREKLVAWLKLIENSNARQDPHSAMAAYDLGWMWEELGIAHLRR